MSESFQENYDYAALNRRINRGYILSDFADLYSLKKADGVEIAYDPRLSPTENVQKLLEEKVYDGDAERAKHHAFDIFHAIHEQLLSSRMRLHGFNDFAQELRGGCKIIKIYGGNIDFRDREGLSLSTFDAASSLLMSAKERKEKIRQRTRVALEKEKPPQPQLSEILRKPLEIPNYHAWDFRFSPEFFRNRGEAPQLVDPGYGAEAVCAGYVTEALRYWTGYPLDPSAVFRMGIEGKDAWEIKSTLLRKNAAIVDNSMNQFFEIRRGRPILSFVVRFPDGKTLRVKDEKAKETPYYGYLFRKFYRTSTESRHPPGLITLHYDGTAYDTDIIRANRERGANSFNSHVTLNLGEGRKHLNLGVFRSKSTQKKVTEVVRVNFPQTNQKFDWAFLDGKRDPKEGRSRVYRNGEQLFYKNGKFYEDKSCRNEALVYQNDRLEWEDVMVMDRFHEQNRVIGLTELMLSGRYELVDTMHFRPEIIPEKFRQPTLPPFPVHETFYLKPGENLSRALLNKGVKPEELPYHFYAYERARIDALLIRPYDAIPFFELSAVVTEVQNRGGLVKTLAEVRQEHAQDYMKRNSDRHIFVIQTGESPAVLAEKILALPAFRELDPLEPTERQFILTALDVANESIAWIAGPTGLIAAVDQFRAGDAVYVNDAWLQTVVEHLQTERVKNAVYIPEFLPDGKDFRGAHFTEKERKLIEKATPNSSIRSALALVLAMEQKQGGRRSIAKSVAEAIGVRVKSLGLFQVRLTMTDLYAFARENGRLNEIQDTENPMGNTKLYENLRALALENDEVNAAIATRRLRENIQHAQFFYRSHGETFDLSKPGCMAFVLNCYHSSEGRVLNNVMNVWVDLLEERLNGKLGEVEKRRPTQRTIVERFQTIARALRDRGEIQITDEEIGSRNMRLGVGAIRHEFFKGRLLAQIEEWYKRKSGNSLSLSIPPEIIDREDVITTSLNYGVRATRNNTLKAIAQYSDEVRERPPLVRLASA